LIREPSLRSPRAAARNAAARRRRPGSRLPRKKPGSRTGGAASRCAHTNGGGH